MKPWFVPLVLLLALATTSCMRFAPMREIKPATFAAWDGEDGPRAWFSKGLTVEIDNVAMGESRHPVWTISAPDMRPARINQLDTWPDLADARVAIGPLTRGGPPSVVMQTFTGGAHCCWHVVIATPAGRDFQITSVDEWDGNEIEWPKDLNGDGRVDFEMTDPSFQYIFGVYVCCTAPPVIIDIRDGRAVDVSTDPSFAPVYRADMARWRDCLTEGGQPECAALAADAARLGEFDRVWPKLAAYFERKDEYVDWNESQWACSGELTPYCRATYTETLKAFLRHTGYIR